MPDTPKLQYFYPPQYKKRNWSAESFKTEDLNALADAFRLFEGRGWFNETARKVYLANALTEHGGARANAEADAIPEDWYNWITQTDEYKAGNQKQKDALIYAATLNYKTGDYANAVYGKPSEKKRVALYNGNGKVIDDNGRVVADSDIHSRKVFSMLKSLQSTENSGFLDSWNWLLNHPEE